ncbi:class I SAM-dependent methyltransferase [Neobacillus drentensis]|uniref:class I SAM-dependent methyltransferase n=1 Tax=Neobacillus drentensis TaxID=220684 RepID=UPI0030000316
MDSKTKWNAKYKERMNNMMEPVPNPRLKNQFAYLNGGIALDLACGLGGNSLFLAGMNYQVESLDISDVAINYLYEYATKNHLNIQPRVCDLTDLNHLNLLNHSFDLVVISYYLDRSLFPMVKEIIKDRGFLFMETFYHVPQTENEGVSAQHKLQPHELKIVFGDWKILFFEENEQEGRQTVFCQKQ